MTALKVMALAGAVFVAARVTAWVCACTYSLDEKLAISICDRSTVHDYLWEHHRVAMVATYAQMLSGAVAIVAMLVAAIQWAVGA